MTDNKEIYLKPVQMDIAAINLEPGPFSMSFGFDLDPLTESINKVGILHPPFVSKGEGSVIEVVAGYRRIHALKKLGWKTIPCIDLSSSGHTDLDLLLLNLHENLIARNFNDIEKSMVLVRLLQYISRSDIEKQYTKTLKIKKISDVDLLVKAGDFDLPIKTSIADGSLSLGAARMISEMEESIGSLLGNILSDLRLSINYQIQFIEYIVEISHAEQIPIIDLIHSNQLNTLLIDKDLNIPQKSKGIMDMLRSRRYPMVSQAEKDFRKSVSRVELPKGVRITHPPFFEAHGFTAEISFKDGKDLKAKIDAMAEKSNLEKIRAPWEDINEHNA